MKCTVCNWNADGYDLKYFRTLSLEGISLQVLAMDYSALNDWGFTYCASLGPLELEVPKKLLKIACMKDKGRGNRSRSTRKEGWVLGASDCVAALKTTWQSQWGIPATLEELFIEQKWSGPSHWWNCLGSACFWPERWGGSQSLCNWTMPPISGLSFHFLYSIFQSRDIFIFIKSSLSIFILLWIMLLVLYLRNFCLT